MWPFSKKFPSIDELPQDDWAVGTGDYEGQPIVVRLNNAARKMIGNPEYPDQVGVAIPANAPGEDGMPVEPETSVLGDIEDKLVQRLGVGGQALLTAVISGRGMREFVFYSSDAAATRKKVMQVNTMTDSHELQVNVEHDPKWRIYKSFMP